MKVSLLLIVTSFIFFVDQYPEAFSFEVDASNINDPVSDSYGWPTEFGAYYEYYVTAVNDFEERTGFYESPPSNTVTVTIPGIRDWVEVVTGESCWLPGQIEDERKFLGVRNSHPAGTIRVEVKVHDREGLATPEFRTWTLDPGEEQFDICSITGTEPQNTQHWEIEIINAEWAY